MPGRQRPPSRVAAPRGPGATPPARPPPLPEQTRQPSAAPPTDRPDTPSLVSRAPTASSESPPASADRTDRPRHPGRTLPPATLAGSAAAPPGRDSVPPRPPDRCSPTPERGSLTRRGNGTRPAPPAAHRPPSRRAPAERQHRASRAALLQRSSPRRCRRLVVHCPAPWSPCRSSIASAPAGVCAPTGAAVHATDRTSPGHRYVFIVRLVMLPDTINRFPRRAHGRHACTFDTLAAVDDGLGEVVLGRPLAERGSRRIDRADAGADARGPAVLPACSRREKRERTTAHERWITVGRACCVLTLRLINSS